MKTSKRFLALVLSALMIFSVVIIPGADLSLFGFEADAAVTLGGITQQRVVDNHEALYRSYQKRFFAGEETNWPTNFVIPGLGSADDYTPQGMTYWKAKEWILISAYDAGGSDASVIYALDVVTTNLVALFKIQNADGTVNKSHGGGIAASEYNFYYADSGSKISYVPLSEMNVAPGTVKEIKLKGSIDCSRELNGGSAGSAATSYCCYDDGVLWTGNFYFTEDAKHPEYAYMANKDSASMLLGYKLAGNSSAEEWYYLSENYNLVKLDYPNSNRNEGVVNFLSLNHDGANAEIRGEVITSDPLGEVTPTFAKVDLIEGEKYKIEFIADNNLSDMYMFAPNGGGHCNVKQSANSTITNLGDGRYHYEMVFTAGLKPNGADSSWPTTQSTSGTYTGTYTIRFDQDSVPAGGRKFSITDFSITKYADISKYPENEKFTPDSTYEGIGCEGNPTYCVALGGLDRVQYAMVDKGKIYISRSWSRTESKNHIRELDIGDMDIYSPGNTTLTVNGRERKCHAVNDTTLDRFGGGQTDPGRTQMLYMGEALCVINDYLYMFGEGAAWNYAGKDPSNVCPEPIDVIWKIDQYAIQGLPRPHEDVTAVEYEKVNSLSEINSTDEYIIVHESPIKDPVTQDNILYLLDAYGGYGDKKLPKKANASEISEASTGDSIGVIGYEIRDYSVKEENGKISLILNAEDDANKSLHWQIESGSSTTLKLKNRDLYFAKHPYFYSGGFLIAMTTSADGSMRIEEKGNGNFCIKGGEYYYLWCNDGAVSKKITAYSNYYENHGKTAYIPVYHNLEEVAGTFHINKNDNPATATAEQTYFQIYKRVSDPYTSTYETQVYTNLDAELTADGTYTVTLETYATNNIQYQKVAERPTDFVFVVDVSGSMDQRDAQGYNTESNWSPLIMGQACGNNNSGFFGRGINYNTAHSGNFWFRFPDGEFGQIHVAFNEKGNSSKYERDIWLWAEHPVTKRCYRLSKFGFMTKGNFAGGADWDQDSAARITDADFLANHMTLGWANEAAVMTDVNADRYRTDYHGERNSTDKRRTYEVMNYTCNRDGIVVNASYYTYGNCQRILGVSQALDKLVLKIQNEANRTGLAHRVAIVTSGSDGTYVSDNKPWANTGILTTGGWKQYTGGTSLSTANYQSAFFNANQLLTVRNYVSKLPVYGHSPINQGLTLASNIIEAQKAIGNTYDINGNRSAVVVVISDGAAGGDNADYNNASNATSCANAAIGNGGLNLKKNGAYIFTVQIGSQDYVSGFDETDFMKYLSSKYTGSKNMSEPGPLNTKENNYYIQIPVGSSFNLDHITNNVFNAVVSNSTNAIASLTTEAVLRERLSSAFDLSDATYTYQTAKSKYDGIGRLYFDTPTTATGIYADVLEETVADGSIERIVEVTGFDYSAKNVSEYNSKAGNGEKLIVTISGVVARHDRELNNTSINNTEETALYQNETFKNSNQPVKRFPIFHFSIPEYTYVFDYGLKMYDSDINGTLLSVDSLPQKQTEYKNELSTNDMGIKFTNNNLDMIYSLKPSSLGNEATSRGYCLIQRDDGTYDWFRINVLPASNVYYEENNGTTITDNTSYSDWSPVKDEKATASPYQQLSTTRDVYGYDENYDNQNTYSYGTAYTSQVDANTMRSDTISFNYTGTAVDIVASCGNETGIYIVTIKNGTSIEKAYIVDTYFTDSSVLNGVTQLNQVPIVHHENVDYGTHTAEVTSVYLSTIVNNRPYALERFTNEDMTFFSRDITDEAKEAILQFAEMEYLLDEDIEVIFCDENSVLNGGTGVEGASGGMATFGLRSVAPAAATTPLTNYFDGYRVYKTMGTNETDYIESEQGSAYFNVINSLASANSIINEKADNFVGYVVGNGDTATTFADYAKKGPANEVYLSKDRAITFTVPENYYNKVMISLRAVSGAPVAKIGEYQFTVKSNTEMYYDITDYIQDSTVVIQNVGEDGDLLAVNNIKFVSQANMPAPAMTFSMPRIRMMMSAPAEDVEPNTPIETESNVVIPEPLPVPEEPSTEPETPDANDGTEEEKDFIEQITENFTKLLNMIQSMLDKIVNLLKSLMA